MVPAQLPRTSRERHRMKSIPDIIAQAVAELLEEADE